MWTTSGSCSGDCELTEVSGWPTTAAKIFRDAAYSHRQKRYTRVIQLTTVGVNSFPQPQVVSAFRLLRAEAEVATSAWEKAQFDCECLLKVGPSPRAWYLLARCRFERKHLAEARHAIECALSKSPDWADGLMLYAEIPCEQRHYEASIRSAKQVHALKRDRPALVLLLRVLERAGKHHELIRVLEEEMQPSARDANIWTTLGFTYNALGDSANAAHSFNQALQLDPTHDNARCGLGYALLRAGNYAEGLVLHEYRQDHAGAVTRLGVPPWRGEPLQGKHLLIWTEQELGDNIQFARFIPLVRRAAHQVTFIVPSGLVRLFRNNGEFGTVVSDQPGFRAADYQTLLLSLPRWLKLGNDIEAVPVPYLRAEPRLVQHWRSRLPTKPKIVLNWQGNPHYGGEPWRSIPLDMFGEIVQRHKSSYEFLSLQKNFGREQLASSGLGSHIHDLGALIDNDGHAFVDSLAILSCVDLLITTDTSLAHLAGAANIETWLMLSHYCDWRWGVASNRTRWYPSMRLFRQPAPGDWASVVREANEALSRIVPSQSSVGATRHSGSKCTAECTIPPQVVGAGEWSTSEGS